MDEWVSLIVPCHPSTTAHPLHTLTETLKRHNADFLGWACVAVGIEVNTHSHNSHFYFDLISTARLWQCFGIPLYQAWTDQYVTYTFVLVLKFKTTFLCFNLIHCIIPQKFTEANCKKEDVKWKRIRRRNTSTMPTRAYESKYFFCFFFLWIQNFRSMHGCGRVRRKETKQGRKAWGHYYICPVLRAVTEKVGIFCESFRVKNRDETPQRDKVRNNPYLGIFLFICLNTVSYFKQVFWSSRMPLL